MTGATEAWRLSSDSAAAEQRLGDSGGEKEGIKGEKREKEISKEGGEQREPRADLEPRFHRLTTRREGGLKKEREACENFSHRGQNHLILLKKQLNSGKFGLQWILTDAHRSYPGV